MVNWLKILFSSKKNIKYPHSEEHVAEVIRQAKLAYQQALEKAISRKRHAAYLGVGKCSANINRDVIGRVIPVNYSQLYNQFPGHNQGQLALNNSLSSRDENGYYYNSSPLNGLLGHWL